MGRTTEISWTDATFNPWIGCTKVSPGCQHCYAEEMMARRFGKVQWGPQGERKRTSPAVWRMPLQLERDAATDSVRRNRRLFCASLADVFEERAELDAWRADIWRLIAQTPHVTWQLLTKRPENVNRMAPSNWLAHAWPANVWVGTSVESQEYADKRIPALLEVPAKVRFLSCEPLLGPLDLSPWVGRLEWVIVGGESGHHARPMDIFWARAIRDACDLAEVPFFFKQLGGTRDKGGALEQIPPDLHIRQFPLHLTS